MTALVTASLSGHLDHGVLAPCLDVVEYLVGQGAQVEQEDNDCVLTPLNCESDGGYLGVVQYLVGQGAELERGDNDGMTPLHVASRNGHLDVVQYLVGQGAELERGDNDGMTPLHVASMNGHLDVVQYLVGQGAQTDREDNNGDTPLIAATHRGHMHVIEYLQSELEQRKEVPPDDAEKVTDKHIKNLSKLLGINHFDPICEAFKFDRKSSLNLLDSNDSNYNKTYEHLLSGWKSGKNLKDLDMLLEKSGIRLKSDYKIIYEFT